MNPIEAFRLDGQVAIVTAEEPESVVVFPNFSRRQEPRSLSSIWRQHWTRGRYSGLVGIISSFIREKLRIANESADEPLGGAINPF